MRKRAHDAATVCIVSFLLLNGCAVGPDYKRPAVPAPPAFRGTQASADPASIADRKWVDIFQDPVLQRLVAEALANNRDLKMAAQRVLAAQGQLQSTRSALFPQIGATGGVGQQRREGSALNLANAMAGITWEIDLFGRIRRATEAATADVRSLEADRESIQQVLVTQVASAYFQLRELDQELLILRDSLQTRQASVRLVTARMTGGVGTSVDVDQATSLVHQADVSISDVERGIEQTENLISYLLARQPGNVERGSALVAQVQSAAVPSGLPSSLLERRPDLRSAEQRLVSANARIGVAKAAFFPAITLTASGGYQSVSLLNVVDRAGPVYGFGGVVDVPIFDFGRRSGNYNRAKAESEAALQTYLKTIDNSFREVADALIGRQKAIEAREKLERLVGTLRHQSRMADLRYRGGVSSYLEVLDTERQRLNFERDYSRGQYEEALSLVTLYKALGGGWQ